MSKSLQETAKDNPFEEWARRSSEFWVRRAVENLVAGVCDGTLDGLERARFVEYHNPPQDLADKLVRMIMDDVLGYAPRTPA